jgi:hypothetical protein
MTEVLAATGDAHVLAYRRTFDELEIEIETWDEELRVVRARGVVVLHDIGTWECDGVVRFPELDDGDLRGYAIVDTEDVATLTFNARELVL